MKVGSFISWPNISSFSLFFIFIFSASYRGALSSLLWSGFTTGREVTEGGKETGKGLGGFYSFVSGLEACMRFACSFCWLSLYSLFFICDFMELWGPRFGRRG